MIFLRVFVCPPPPLTSQTHRHRHTDTLSLSPSLSLSLSLSLSAACMRVCKIRFHMFVHMCECGHMCVCAYCNLSIYLQYIKKRNFKKGPWRWSYTGSKRPKPKDRIQGYYHKNLKSGVLTYGNLTVIYKSINPRHSKRFPGGTLLEVTCLDPDFRTRSYPGSLCGMWE